MESKTGFFSNDQTQRTIKNFLASLNGLSGADDFETSRNQHINLILSSMQSSPDQWDSNCSINIGWIGDSFISRLSKESDINQKLNDIYSICFRFLFELYLSIKNDLSIEFEQARKFAIQNIDRFEGNVKTQIEFAIREMPIAILKSLINHDSIDSIKSFNLTTEKAQQMKEDWNRELDEKTERINTLKLNLDKYNAAYNFVGLHQGFDELAQDKYSEKNNILKYLKVFGVLTVVPIISELIYIYLYTDTLSKNPFNIIFSAIPTVSLVAILIYYFRILLFNYRAVKSQILQIEFRKTLCRFIQNYVDYSAEIKLKDKESLARFENIIFSGLVSSDEKLPSTFDGVEQLAGFIKAIKS